jgi:hypothetical protein
VPGEFLAVDVGGCGCAVTVEFHAVGCDVFSSSVRKLACLGVWGREKAAKMPKTMVMAPSTKNMNGLGFSVQVFMDSDVLLISHYNQEW